jgi:asparagine synthase (glutamine-hydrolysing)
MSTDLSANVISGVEHQPCSGWWIASFTSVAEPPALQSSILRTVGKGCGKFLHLFSDSTTELTFASAHSCSVIFDGLLYNGDELKDLFKERLERETNEAGLVLQAYLQWGEEALLKIKGLFSLVVWDGREGLLLSARDPIGIYPLFYAWNGEELLLSTSIEVLVRHPHVSNRVNRLVLAEHMCHLWLKLEETCYEAVRRVPPGHAMRIDRSGCRVHSYWSPAPQGQKVDWIKEGELELFDEMLGKAVGRFLRMGQTGIYLSGGLDSVSVAAVATDMARQTGKTVPLALSLLFPDPECNEEPVQRGVAKGLGLPQVLLPFDEAVGQEGLLERAMELSRSWPGFLLNVWLPAYHQLGRKGRERGCKIVLTGSGGDEWLSVSPYLSADLIRNLDIGSLYNYWRSINNSYQIERLRFLQNMLWMFGLRPLVADWAKRTLAKAAPSLLGSIQRKRSLKLIPDWISRDPALRREILRRIDESRPGADIESYYFNEIQTSLLHPLTVLELEETFETGRRLGLKIVHPFWDADLVCMLYRVLPQSLNRNGRSKGLVREMLARRFPDLGFGRQKKVLANNFFVYCLMQESPAAWKKLGGIMAMTALDIIDEKALNSYIGILLTGKEPKSHYRIWDALNMESWLRPRI